jgi:hypothetical protein
MGALPSDRTKLGLDKQVLWLCRWGTQTALVWAVTAVNAELRVRHGAFSRRLTLDGVLRKAETVFGVVYVSRATAEDIDRFTEAGGNVPT